MNVFKIIMELLIPISLFILLFFYYYKNMESKTYKKFDFKNKGEYFCCFYLTGDALFKPNLSVISKSSKGYLFEVETDYNIDSFFINYDDISIINIKQVDSKTGYKVFDTSKKIKNSNVKIKKGYKIKIITKKDKKYTILSKKNPKSFFNK